MVGTTTMVNCIESTRG